MFKMSNVVFKNILSIESLEIPAHKVVSIVGRSGSGKSTLLKLLNRMVTPDRGHIYYRERNLDSIPVLELRRKVVMLSQSPVIYDGTIRDNLNIGLVFSEKGAACDQELSDCLDFVGLKKSLDDSPSKLSGGEKQRLSICRALLMKPEVLLLDEPSAALDSSSELRIVENLISISKKYGFSIVMVTHSKQVYENLSDLVVTVESGNISSVEVRR